METVKKLVHWILLSFFVEFLKVEGGSVVLNGPPIETADLRAIDGYVASGLPLFTTTKGFVLHSGSRPVIVKKKDPNKIIRDGVEQPNTSYYRDLPAVIPAGFEGLASSSFLLGNPIPPSQFFAPSSGPVVSFQQPIRFQGSNFGPIRSQVLNSAQPIRGQGSNFEPMRSEEPMREQSLDNGGQEQNSLAQPSLRVENTLSLNGQNRVEERMSEKNENSELRRNPVVVETSDFESKLPTDLRNPFYSDMRVAMMLADESLPAPGEEVVQMWNTNKIREGRVRDLLSGAGLI